MIIVNLPLKKCYIKKMIVTGPLISSLFREKHFHVYMAQICQEKLCSHMYNYLPPYISLWKLPYALFVPRLCYGLVIFCVRYAILYRLSVSSFNKNGNKKNYNFAQRHTVIVSTWQTFLSLFKFKLCEFKENYKNDCNSKIIYHINR